MSQPLEDFRPASKNQAGATLIELILTVALIGILSSVAIVSFLRYTRKSKAAEAPINIKAIATGALAWYSADHSDQQGRPLPKHFPNAKSPWEVRADKNNEPWARVCGLFKKNVTTWHRAPWTQLRFSIAKAHWYHYHFDQSGVNENATYTIEANSDLDCDGVLSTYKTVGIVHKKSGEILRSQLLVVNGLE